jgi:drug/metabolite transporter (DMT)-like permease
VPEFRFGLPILYLAIFLLALTGLFAKVIPLDAVSIIQLRGVVAAIGLALFSGYRKRSLRLNGIRTCAGVYFLGLVLGIHWVTFFHSMQISSVAVGMLAMFSFPMITILLEPFFTGRRLKIGDLFAGTVTLAGLGVMVWQDQANPTGSVTPGVLWGVLSAVLFSLRNLFQKYRFSQVPSDSLMFHQVVAVGLLLVFFVDYPRVSALAGEDVLKIILLGIICTAGAHTLLVFSLKHLLAKSIALISCLQPVIATGLAWLVVKEVPGPSVLLGGAVVLSVAAYESLKKPGAAQQKNP